MPGDNKKRASYSIKRHAHGDPPRESWPGREIDARDVQLAASHKMDELPEAWRHEAHQQATAAHLAAYPERQVKPHWNFTLILGRMGSGKSTLAAILAYSKYIKGWPVFHSGSFLFGRELAADRVYTAVNDIPDNSVLFMDEAHVIATLGGDTSRHALLLLQSIAGLRKKNCELILATASDDLMSRRLKREAHELLIPFKPKIEPHKDMSIRAMHRRYLGLAPLDAAPRGSNLYRLAFYRVPDFPFNMDNTLTQLGLEDKAESLADRKMYLHGPIPPRTVRIGLLLNDSFRPVAIGSSFVNRQAIVDRAGDALWGGPAAVGGAEASPEMEPWQWALWNVYVKLRDSGFPPTRRMQVSDLATLANCDGLDVPPRRFASQLRIHAGIEANGKGYQIGEIVEGLAPVFHVT